MSSDFELFFWVHLVAYLDTVIILSTKKRRVKSPGIVTAGGFKIILRDNLLKEIDIN